MSFVERLSSLCRLKCTSIIEKGPQSVYLYHSLIAVDLMGRLTGSTPPSSMRLEEGYRIVVPVPHRTAGHVFLLELNVTQMCLGRILSGPR